MAKIAKSAVLHSNGEQFQVEGAANVKRLIQAFPGSANGFGHIVGDDKNIIIGMTDGSAFIELKMEDDEFTLAEKPQCNNFLDCKEKEPETPKKEAEKPTEGTEPEGKE